MTGAGAVIWLIVMGLAIYAVVGRKRPKTERFADRFVLIGGVAFPSVVLAALLVFGLSLLPSWTAGRAGRCAHPRERRAVLVADRL